MQEDTMIPLTLINIGDLHAGDIVRVRDIAENYDVSMAGWEVGQEYIVRSVHQSPPGCYMVRISFPHYTDHGGMYFWRFTYRKRGWMDILLPKK